MPDVQQKLSALIADQLGTSPEEVKPTSLLVDDLGADSLDLIEILIAVEEELGVVLDDAEFEKAATVEEVAALVATAKEPAR